MVKLTLFWDKQSKLFRTAFVWFIVIQIIRIGVSYFNQNIGFSDMNTAHMMDKVHQGILFIEIIVFVIALLGFVSGFYNTKIVKKDDAVEIAKGVWMVKK